MNRESLLRVRALLRKEFQQLFTVLRIANDINLKILGQEKTYPVTHNFIIFVMEYFDPLRH